MPDEELMTYADPDQALGMIINTLQQNAATAIAENARLRAANKRLTYLLGHVLKNGRLEDDEMADARAALADSGPAEQEA